MWYKFIVLFAVLCTVEAASSTGHIFDAEKNVEYPLNKPLEVGDVIRAWGVYRDHSTSKFSVNIKGQGGIFLLHVDFRPWNNVVVMNNYVYGWKTEIRPWFSKYNFSWNKLFEVKIEVHEGHYRIYFNGVELRRRFPHRIDIGRASHVNLHGGSNGFKWSALKLPNSETDRVMGVPFSTTTNEKNYLDRPLAVGDKFTAWGIYARGSNKFSVNLMMETELHFMMHVDFRPPPNENKVVLNSKKENGWEREMRTPIPQFENGKVFSVTVVCLEGEFEIYHDNQALGSRFPYRDGFKLEDVKFVWLLGGSRGMIWTDLAISQPRPEYQVKVMCDDISTIFVDGEQQTVSGTGVWNQIATLNIPTTTQTIGVQCRNTGGPYGLMAQVTEESGEIITVTDESWQCSNRAEYGWSTREFRGSWAAAVVTYQQLDFQREEGDWAGMSPDKRVIWTGSAADTNVYCRRDLSDSDSGSDTEVFTEVTEILTTETEKFTEIEITEEPTEEELTKITVSESMTSTSQGTPAYTVPQECNDLTTGTIRNFDFETDGMIQRFEGKFQIITCKMRRTEIDSCNDVLSGLKNETNLLLHHIDNQHQVDGHVINENKQTVILEGDDRYLFKVQFKFAIKYEAHHERSIYCGASNSDKSLRVVSQTRRIPRVEKLYKVSVFPKEVRVPTNTPFTLTCFFEDPEVRNYVFWQRKDSNDGIPWITVGNSRIANNNSSVLTITKSEEWKGTYSCSTRKNLHPSKYRDQAIVEVFDAEFTKSTETSQPKEPTLSTEPAGSVSSTESEEITSSTPWRKPTEAPRPSCKEDEFTCRERCISSTWRCDGDRDCIGGEDEQGCDKTENEIKPL